MFGKSNASTEILVVDIDQYKNILEWRVETPDTFKEDTFGAVSPAQPGFIRCLFFIDNGDGKTMSRVEKRFSVNGD